MARSSSPFPVGALLVLTSVGMLAAPALGESADPTTQQSATASAGVVPTASTTAPDPTSTATAPVPPATTPPEATAAPSTTAPTPASTADAEAGEESKELIEKLSALDRVQVGLSIGGRLSPPETFAPVSTEITEVHAPIGGVADGSVRAPSRRWVGRASTGLPVPG